MFRIFGPDHLCALAVIALLCAQLFFFRKQLPRGGQIWTGRILACLLLAYAVTIYTKMGLEGNLSWDYSLPLHLCHWVLIACMISLVHPHPLTSELAYFWGLGGTVQALLTPDLAEEFPSWEFIQFFWSHGGILLAIVYFIAIQRFRPRPGSVLRMFMATNVYALFVGALNFIFTWNYGYLRQPPSQPSLIDYLGPWPWYILSLEVIALVTFWILDLPWKILDRRKSGSFVSLCLGAGF